MIKREESRHDLAFLAGVIVGAISGALAALALTPMSGAQTREKLKDTTSNLTPVREKVAESASHAVATSKEKSAGFTAAASQAMVTGKEKAADAASHAVATSKEMAASATAAAGQAMATGKEKAADATTAASQALATGKEKAADAASHAVATSKEMAASATAAAGQAVATGKDKAAEVAARSPLPVGQKEAAQDLVVREDIATHAPEPDGAAKPGDTEDA